MPAENFPQLRRMLLRWYERNRRDLPWRRTRDPYAIWVSETMLQQTQVATAIPYYQRFLKELPTIGALARAPRMKILSLWSGLGYYRRADNLKKAAVLVVRQHGGAIPSQYEAIRALPGVGDYTAGALMSIAFDQPYAAIDANVRRVLHRVFALKSEKELRELAPRLVPKRRAGDFNQSLIELGATVCAPSAPHCDVCPLISHCAARRGGLRRAFATTKKPSRNRNVTWPLAIVLRGRKILLRRRAANGLLAGLWELPGGELKHREKIATALRLHLKPLGDIVLQQCIGELRHAITDRNIRAPIFLLRVAPEQKFESLPSWRWLHPSILHRYPVSSMTVKALKVFAAHETSSV